MKPYAKWHLPLSHDKGTLGDSLEDITKHGADSIDNDIPLIIRLVENPKFGWLNDWLFPGSANLKTHDAIHILLGRGMLPKDEAFVIGYTMGSTKEMTEWRINLFCWLNQEFYPKAYRFSQEEVEVFRSGVKWGWHCETNLSKIFVEDILDKPINIIRQALDIDADWLKRIYEMEAEEFPHSKESIRSAELLSQH